MMMEVLQQESTTKNNTMNPNNGKRHCAFCHKPLQPDAVRTCAKCRRRPYCGRECQEMDWKSIKSSIPPVQWIQSHLNSNSPCVPLGDDDGWGQGHRNWCGQGVLEEDVDWEVVPIQGKGRGLVAKTLIPPLTRIVVDSCICRNKVRLAVKQKHPNSLALDKQRVWLLNHACDANASRFPEPFYQVYVIFSNREIKPGEEICTNYLDFSIPPITVTSPFPEIPNTPPFTETLANYIQTLRMKFGIACSTNCFCRKEGLFESLAKWSRTFGSIGTEEECLSARTKKDCMRNHALDMERVECALKENEELTRNPWARAIILLKGFEVASRTKLTLHKGMGYMKEAVEIWMAMTHPKSDEIKSLRELVEDPSSYKGFQCIDKKWG